MGWFDSVTDFVSDVADGAVDVVTDVADELVDTAADTLGTAGQLAGGVIGAVGSAANAATGGLAGMVMTGLDDTVLDAIDEATRGVIDIDFDDGNFSAGIGIDGLARTEASIGEDGVSASADTLISGAAVGITTDGFDLEMESGIDTEVLGFQVPYSNLDVDIDPNGDISVEAEVQGTLPTPYGIVTGEVAAGYVDNADVTGGYVTAEGALIMEGGTTIAGGVDASYVTTDDGSQLSLGAHGAVSRPGTGVVGGSVGYDRIERGDVVIEQVEADVFAAGHGVTAQAGVDHMSISTPEGSVAQTDTHVDVGGVSEVVESFASADHVEDAVGDVLFDGLTDLA